MEKLNNLIKNLPEDVMQIILNYSLRRVKTAELITEELHDFQGNDNENEVQTEDFIPFTLEDNFSEWYFNKYYLQNILKKSRLNLLTLHTNY